MRIIALLFALATISACATIHSARAQAPDGVAPCLASAEPDARRACIGTVSGPCMEAPGGETTGGMVQCLVRERDLWAAQVSELTTQLRVQASPTQTEQLEALLAAHEAWMRARCGYAASRYEGGSLARVLAAACARDTTAELALDLLARGDEG